MVCSRTVQELTTDLIDIIDSKNHEIRPEDEQVYSKMEDLADELPESSPRFILLSYPLTLVRSLHIFCQLPPYPSHCRSLLLISW